MRSLLLITISLGLITPVLAQGPTGSPKEFLNDCQKKQSSEFCQCALKTGLKKESSLAIDKLRQTLEIRRNQHASYLEHAKKNSPELSVSQFDTLCDIAKAYIKERNAYLEDKTGINKFNSLSKELQEKHRPVINRIFKKYTIENEALHDQFGSSGHSRNYFNLQNSAYCFSDDAIKKAEQNYQRAQQGQADIDFVRVFRKGLEAGNACREVFRPPSRISAWKFDDFWQTNRLSYLIGAVYDGQLTYPQDADFKAYFSLLQVAYDAQCQQHLPKNSVRRGFSSQRVRGDGSRENPEDNSFLIDPRFVEKYDEYKSSATASGINRFMKNVNQSLEDFSKGGGLFKSAGKQLNDHPTVQFSRFIRANGCLSKDVQQLRENFHRRAYGKLSLQQERGEVPLANKRHGLTATEQMYEACKNRPHASSVYCSCFAALAPAVMTYSEFKYFSKYFDRYYKDVRQKLGSDVPPQDRKWQLNEIHNQCAI